MGLYITHTFLKYMLKSHMNWMSFLEDIAHKSLTYKHRFFKKIISVFFFYLQKNRGINKKNSLGLLKSSEAYKPIKTKTKVLVFFITSIEVILGKFSINFTCKIKKYIFF
ncbi:unnamed protein product [Meganyctiphanes norvegica]|uniref:Uncharacterized protein n=1 Tax=Meganyctiphanes norvegica TaxID=48144 RepID=A0AAV2RLC3_MEGNR